MADITLDQLIADLCVIRGKCPKTGKWKLVKAEVDGDNFYLKIIFFLVQVCYMRMRCGLISYMMSLVLLY